MIMGDNAAFPNSSTGNRGMDTRTAIAKDLMAALLSKYGWGGSEAKIARWAVIAADALIVALNEPTP